MNKGKCLFTYEPLKEFENIYSKEGLKSLSRRLDDLRVFPYTAEEQRRESQSLASKMSIQGMQPKLSGILEESKSEFQIREKGGQYIIKPSTLDYPELPENEDCTMDLAQMANFEIPWHGLIQCSDGSRSYIIRRFDRKGRKEKVPIEDFAQLIGASRSTKYLATTERVAEAIEEFCTFPSLELLKLYRLVVFSFLVGNEDLHLKNFSLITEPNNIRLSPCYDLVNTTIALAAPKKELALELRGKKTGFERTDFIKYLASEVCLLPEKKAIKELSGLLSLLPQWKDHIRKSFLSPRMKKLYLSLLEERAARVA